MTHKLQTTVQGFPIRTGAGGAYIPKTLYAMQSLSAWKKENSEAAAPDLWLRLEICKAFQQMLLLRLDGVPAAELIAGTAEMWVTVVGENLDEATDRERISKGFALLLRKLKKWPQPAELLEALPARIKAPASATVKAGMSDEEHKAATERFQQFMDGLGKNHEQ